VVIVKLAIIGGGGFRVPLVYRALCADTHAQRITTVCLYDVDPLRLAGIAHVVRAIAEQSDRTAYGDPPTIEVTDSIDVALDGADFVFSAIRVGGLAGRVADERVAIAHGLIGQETTGPGGIAYGLRTIPVALDLARRVRGLAPNAWVVNFTNPAGMITEAMSAVLGERVIGICDSPVGLARRAARALGHDLGDCMIDYSGLNHLGWLHRLTIDGIDRLPDLLADDAALAPLEETQIFGADWLRLLSAIPNEYLHYYYLRREALAGQQGATRGEFLRDQQAACYALLAPDTALTTWEAVLRERNSTYLAAARGEGNERAAEDLVSGGYEGVALELMSALARGADATLILNVAAGAQLGLPADAVVEVPCHVDAGTITPLPTSPLTGSMRGLVEQVKAVDRLAIEAATTGSARAAELAFAQHPLVDSTRTAATLLTDYRRAIPALDAVFTGRT